MRRILALVEDYSFPLVLRITVSGITGRREHKLILKIVFGSSWQTQERRGHV